MVDKGLGGRQYQKTTGFEPKRDYDAVPVVFLNQLGLLHGHYHMDIISDSCACAYKL
jgi:hypothetical protein